MKKIVILVLGFCFLLWLTGCLEGHYTITEDGRLVRIDDEVDDMDDYVPTEDDTGMDMLCHRFVKCRMYENMDQCFDEAFQKSDTSINDKCIDVLDAFYFCMSERECSVLEGYYFDNAKAPTECKEEDDKVASCALWGMIGL